VLRASARGVFPPVGIISVLALTVLTAIAANRGANRSFWPFYLFLAGGLIAGVLLWLVPRRRYSTAFAGLFGWLPVLLGAVSYPYWYLYARLVGSTPSRDFFNAAAGVLPVLLLATVLDVRRTRDLESRQLVLPVAAVFLGELAALNALAFGDQGAIEFAAVSSSLVVSAVALILAVMADITPSPGTETGAPVVPVSPAARESAAPVPPAAPNRSADINRPPPPLKQSGETPRCRPPRSE
jgi:hypothetical protein